MSERIPPGEEQLAALLRALPAPPEAWVRAAQEVPVAKRRLEAILARADRDEAFAEALRADARTALGVEDGEDEAVLSAVRTWLASDASGGR